MPPGLQRDFGFQRWLDFDEGLWDTICSKRLEGGIRRLPVGSDNRL